MTQSLTVRIENHLACMQILPPTETFPNGLRLIPGLNTVPRSYLAELEAREKHIFKQSPRIVEVGEGSQKRNIQVVDTVFDKTTYPGKEMLKDMTTTQVVRVTSAGKTVGPRISIYQDALPDRDDGPPPPVTLPANPKAAKLLIDATENKKTLELWLGNSRGEVASLVRGKLASLA